MINERDVWGSVDAELWADFWIQTLEQHPEIATSRETMVTWFANTIEAGRSHERIKRMIKDAGCETFEEYIKTVVLDG